MKQLQHDRGDTLKVPWPDASLPWLGNLGRLDQRGVTWGKHLIIAGDKYHVDRSRFQLDEIGFEIAWVARQVFVGTE